MSDFDRTRFTEEAAPGSILRVLLRTGREYTGTVEKVSSDQVALKNSNGTVRIPFGWIIDWELLAEFAQSTPPAVPPQPPARGHDSGDPPSEVPAGVQPLHRGPQSTPPPAPRVGGSGVPRPPESASSPAFARIVDIQARFRAELSLDRLNPLGPEFRNTQQHSSYLTQQRITRALADLKNKWDYAHSVNELSRLQGSIRTLQALATEHPDTPVFLFVHGSFLLELGDVVGASRAFRLAALAGDDRAFFNLAATALTLGRRELACCALSYYFVAFPAFGMERTWRFFAALAIQERKLALLGASLAFQLGLGESRFATSLVETAVYALNALEQTNDASRVADTLLSRGKNGVPDTSEAVAVAAKLMATADSAFTDVEAVSLQADVVKRSKRAELAVTVTRLLTEAKQKHDQGNTSLALEVLNRVLQADPTQNEAQQLKRAWTQKAVPRQSSPGSYRRGSRVSPLAEARAADLRKDLGAAERYYRQAITENDNWEAAAKGLAMLLPRMNRHSEAIQLLESRLDQFVNKRPAQQIVWNLYQIIGKYDRALAILHELLKEGTADERIRLYKSLAYCHYKAGQFVEAESTLQKLLLQKPDDLDAKRVLEQLQTARHEGGTASLAESFRTLEPIIEFANPQGDFVTFHLDRCDYFGVDATRLVKRDLSLESIGPKP